MTRLPVAGAFAVSAAIENCILLAVSLVHSNHTLVPMPSDEYTSVARGPLKLKGTAGVTKKKKKKNKTDLEKNLSTGGSGSGSASETALVKGEDEGKEKDPENAQQEEKKEEEEEVYKTEAEKRFLEAKRKRVCPRFPTKKKKKTLDIISLKPRSRDRRDTNATGKQLKELTESAKVRPQLLKTHKQRVEELNAHLARLTDHHDMPKIGPG